VPIEDVEAGDLRAGDVVRVDDPQAHRVERVVRVGARVVLEVRPVGLEGSVALLPRWRASSGFAGSSLDQRDRASSLNATRIRWWIGRSAVIA
jgi:hypothetical protein